MGVWIDAAVELPETDGKYICRYGFVKDGCLHDMRFIGTLDYYATDQEPHFQHESEGLRVTHWMELPLPPEQTKATNFERVTASPEALAGVLTSIPTAEAPWDEAFREAYCTGCEKENCDVCPYEENRNNPLWWLGLEAT